MKCPGHVPDFAEDWQAMRQEIDSFGAACAVAALIAWGFASAAEPQPELFEPGLVSTGFDDSHLSFAPDGGTMYFLRNTPDFMHWTILTSRRSGAGWGRLTIAPFSGRWSDADVFVTRDGQRIFFVSTRPIADEAKQDTDIWLIEREGDGYGAPRRITELSSGGYEWFPTLTDSGTIYFGSERAGGRGQSDIWRARWLGDRFSEPENLGPVINSGEQEIEPLIARDESWLIVAAKGREPSVGNYDLYLSYNCPDGWTTPRLLGAGVNSAGWDFAPHMAPDGTRFYFTSDRADTGGPLAGIDSLQALETVLSSPRNGLRDIYSVDAEALGIRRRCD
jgi:Tol biopolymer transport system component